MPLTRRESLALLTSLATGAQPTQPNRFVRTSGKDLVDSAGKAIMLRGINLGNWLEPEGYMFLFEHGPQSPREIWAFVNELIGPTAALEFWKQYRQSYITEADIQFLKKCGFNSVRVPFHYEFFHESEDGFRLLDPLIDWCKGAGIWIILDMHCAPGGQTGTNIDDSWGYPWLYESSADQELTCRIWRKIAARYHAEPAILGYDLLNEPVPHYPKLQQYNSKLEPLLKRITAAVREEDKNHVIFMEAAQWDSNFKVFGPPFDSNSVYEFHKYWTAPEQSVIQEYLDYRDRYNVPIWLGESGENSDEWIAKFVAVLEKNQIGWCFWPYKKMDQTSCVASIRKPENWDQIVAFAQMPPGTGNSEKRIAARPSLTESRAAFHDLLHKIRFSECRINDGYLKALGLHQ